MPVGLREYAWVFICCVSFSTASSFTDLPGYRPYGCLSGRFSMRHLIICEAVSKPNNLGGSL